MRTRSVSNGWLAFAQEQLVNHIENLSMPSLECSYSILFLMNFEELKFQLFSEKYSVWVRTMIETINISGINELEHYCEIECAEWKIWTFHFAIQYSSWVSTQCGSVFFFHIENWYSKLEKYMNFRAKRVQLKQPLICNAMRTFWIVTIDSFSIRFSEFTSMNVDKKPWIAVCAAKSGRVHNLIDPINGNQITQCSLQILFNFSFQTRSFSLLSFFSICFVRWHKFEWHHSTVHIHRNAMANAFPCSHRQCMFELIKWPLMHM